MTSVPGYPDAAQPARPVRLQPADAARCRRRVHLDHDPDADRSLMLEPDDGLRLRFETQSAHRREVVAAIESRAALRRGWTPSDGERPPLLAGPVLVTDHRRATPDLLVRMPDGGYVPILIRGHRTTDPGSGATITDLATLTEGAPPTRVVSSSRKARAHHSDGLALAHVHRLLVELGLSSRETVGGIIGFGSSSTDPAVDDGALIVWHDLAGCTGNGAGNGQGATSILDDYDARFADRLAVAIAAATGAEPLARPSRVAECRRCPWWTVCGPELEATHDVSLLVAGGDVEILRAAGMCSYDDVAGADPLVLAALPLTGIPAAEATIRARAMAAGVPLVRRRATVDVARADVELDVDMESYLDDGAYLWGTLLSGRPLDGFEPGYRPFATWSPLDSDSTATNFVAFWQYLTSLRAACAEAGLSFAAYCYSHRAEERWLYGTPARFPDAAGMPSRTQIAEFCQSDQWVDLYQEIKRLYVVPGSLRLKAVAPIAGFRWRDPEPGGENSMAWYRIALGGPAAPGALPERAETADPAPTGADSIASADVVRHHRDRILRYNEDDCRATWQLRHWMSEHPEAMPTAAELAG